MLNIEELYNMLSNNKKDLFNTKEEQQVYNDFYKKYIAPLNKGKALEFKYKALMDYCNVIETERRISFANGFKTAVSLMLGDNFN
ncbi:MAG: hypothetical protein HDT44_05095 [Ruminococcaceae bacterium]|nr:hypothetical protein [Oscillospiraceae bacterium]